MKPFSAATECLGELDVGTAARVIAATADISLILDDAGVILDTASGSNSPSVDIAGRWLGRNWAETVTAQSREKIEGLIADARAGNQPRWRQVYHPVPGGPDVPVTYCAIAVAGGGRLIAVGRDLSAEASMQRRLVDAQQSLESNYWQLRQAETRYRMLFHLASEPVIMIDARKRCVVEANPAANRLLAGDDDLAGRAFPGRLWEEAAEPLKELLDTIAAMGRAEEVSITDPEGDALRVSGSLLRQRTDDLILLRMAPRAGEGQAPGGEPRRRMLQIIEQAPDAVVVTDDEGTVFDANRAFLELAQLTHEHQVRQKPLNRWLGREGVDLEILLTNLRRHGTLPLYATTLRGEHGGVSRVEVAASVAWDADGSGRIYGFFVRNVDTRPCTEIAPSDHDHARSVEQMAQMVGQMPLKELVRESTDLIERLCIEAALELTGNNRASAAELLGLSRQSLYAKLRRHGLMNLDDSAHT